MKKTLWRIWWLRLLALGTLLLFTGASRYAANRKTQDTPIKSQQIAAIGASAQPPATDDPFADTPLVAAARDGDNARVLFLLRQGANVNAEHGAALMVAADSGKLSTVKLLLKQGANLHINDHNGYVTPLEAATENGYTDVAAYLIRRGANANARNDEGEGPLDIADHMGCKDIAALLRKAGAKRFISREKNEDFDDIAAEAKREGPKFFTDK